MTKEIDAYISDRGYVREIIIHTKEFPGWVSFGAFISKVKFIKDHHKKVKRVAAVTDSKLMSIAPVIANNFVSAEVKHFDYADMETTKTWVKEAAS